MHRPRETPPGTGTTPLPADLPVGQTTKFLRENPFGNTEFLLERARAGSEAAWREFYRRYRTMLLVQVRARIRGHRGADSRLEESLQNAFAKAWFHIQDFEYRGEGSFRSYLCTLVLNDFFGQAQAKDGKRERPLLASELEEVDGREARERAEKDQLLERKSSMLEKLGELEELDRDVLIMRYFEDLSFERMAAILDCSREKARTRCLRAIERLTRLMNH